VVSGLPSRQRKLGLNHRLSFPKKRRSSYSKSSIHVCCGELWQEILGLGTPVILDQDDAGTLLMTGSIGGVTVASAQLFSTLDERALAPTNGILNIYLKI
jgi:hypothetical protein